MKSDRFSKVAGLIVGLIIAVFVCIKIEVKRKWILWLNLYRFVSRQASPFYWTDYDFTRVENIDCSLMKTNVKVKRINRTCSGFSGTVELKTEMSNEWEFEGVLLYSSKGNN